MSHTFEALSQFLRTGRIVVLESRKESTTGKSEMKLGLAPSIYLYAGRVFPNDFAQAAFLVTHQSLTVMCGNTQRQRETTRVTSAGFSIVTLRLSMITGMGFLNQSTVQFSTTTRIFEIGRLKFVVGLMWNCRRATGL
jgi:hypothetical protein